MTALSDSFIIGESAAIVRLRELIATAAPSRLSVLIEGPTGSGKELVAAALHSASGRRGPFVPFNVCAISESMFEDALFGHVRGAFTGAHGDTLGFLAEANGGTAFFDEISGLGLGLQAKLLRAIESGAFRPVGARRDTRSDFRVVSATNERLDDLAIDGRFRPDLMYRLRGVALRVPPLADRSDDIPPLARHFLDQAGAQHVRMSPTAIDALQRYTWPGNVRELKQVIEWLAVASSLSITGDDVRQALGDRARSPAAADPSIEDRALVRTVLDRHAWNADAASRELGIHRATLYRRMKQLGLVGARARVRPKSGADLLGSRGRGSAPSQPLRVVPGTMGD